MAAGNGEFLLGQLTLLSGGMISANRVVRVGALKQDAVLRSRRRDEQLKILLYEIQSRIAAGDSMGAIARDLNNRGLRGRYGGRWYHASVKAFAKRHFLLHR